MIGGITVEYRPGEKAVSTILGAVADAGFVLRGLRVTPTFDGQRSILSLELDDCARHADLAALEREIMASGAALGVLHRAKAGAVA